MYPTAADQASQTGDPEGGAAAIDRPDDDGPRPRRAGRLLVIDDSATHRYLLRKRLGGEGYEILEASDGPSGLEACRAIEPDLILLDVRLPGWDGFETIRRLKDDPATRTIPVIFLSAAGSPEERARGLDLGAVDYVVKPFDTIELKARARAALRAKRAEDLLRQQAQSDALTGLGNRRALEERLESALAACRRRGQPLSVLIADIDHFKRINDRHGHAAGDAILRRVGAELCRLSRGGDFAARLGGEEFVLLAPECDAAGALGLAERLRASVAGLVVEADGRMIAVTVSIGVATAGESPEGPDELLDRADRALYDAKADGRNAVRFRGAAPAPEPGVLALCG